MISSENEALSSLIFLQRAGAGKSPVLLPSPLEELSGGGSDDELDELDELLDDSDEELGLEERPASGSMDELLDSDEELLLAIPLEEPSG
jgi:hypothetical protein